MHPTREQEEEFILTGKNSCKENVVWEGYEPTFSKGVKYTAFISKFFSFLGNFLLNIRFPPKNKEKDISELDYK